MKCNLIKINSLIMTPLICGVSFSLSCSCNNPAKVAAPVDDGTFIKDTDYSKVFVISGQSNAVGCSLVSYLKKNLSNDEFVRYETGINNVLISECLTQELPATNDFIPTKINRDAFGLELGFADIMSKRSKQKVYVIKYAVGGTILDKQWMDGKFNRGVLYNNMIAFIRQGFAKLPNAKLCGFCWMQGESDTFPYEISRYYENTTKFVGFLREDLKDITADGGLNFIDAGISNSWNKFNQINDAKMKFWKESDHNGYFSTSENGLTTNKEPEGQYPDLAHYDSISELELGRWFALKSLQMFNKNN